MRAALFAIILAVLPLPALAGATALTALNVRAGPGTDHPVIDVLRPGEGVAVAHCQPGWCLIRSRHGDGWASAGYLAGLVDRHQRVARHVIVDHVAVDRVIVVERRRVARFPEPWSEPIFPPRRLPMPWPYAVQYPERFW
jgi:uncharacterized protein YraI